MEKNSNEREIIEKIIDHKNRLGKELIILTHHYQRKSIVDVGDYQGDSFGLSQTAASDAHARYIVFCGVHFMAESAAILAGNNQIVQIPDPDAGCWMSDMADTIMVEKAWNDVTHITGKDTVTPIVYMNSDAYIKAHCGENGGVVCTSSNAHHAFSWAFERREKIFFFPDEHLGRNTGNRLGVSPDEMIVWDPQKPLGGNTESQIRKSKIILWKGYCLVHTRFTVADMKKKREEFPEALIVVHPECTEDVVAMADATGSTSFIVKYVKNAPPGSTIIIGTEINLIDRLAVEYTDRKILPLKESMCPNMYKISPEKLLDTLYHIGELNVVTVPEDTKAGAKLALDRMLLLPSN
ncbi:MAG: quinolinate synthase NadA [Proteobacteria bacterium]|nr:quinolinate synthase NadA [Pseudomonadota bacterium]